MKRARLIFGLLGLVLAGLMFALCMYLNANIKYVATFFVGVFFASAVFLFVTTLFRVERDEETGELVYSANNPAWRLYEKIDGGEPKVCQMYWCTFFPTLVVFGVVDLVVLFVFAVYYSWQYRDWSVLGEAGAFLGAGIACVVVLLACVIGAAELVYRYPRLATPYRILFAIAIVGGSGLAGYHLTETQLDWISLWFWIGGSMLGVITAIYMVTRAFRSKFYHERIKPYACPRLRVASPKT